MDDYVIRLSALDACAVSDAKDSLSLPSAVSGISRRTTNQTIAGKVLTVKLVRADDPAFDSASAKRHLCTESVQTGGSGDVIVVEQRTGIDAGSWGGVLSQAAHQKQIEGVIIDGPCRDIDQAREIGFPVFARSLTARTARGRVRELENGGTIQVGDQTVDQDDYVIADASGIVFIRAADIEPVLDAAERISDKEADMVDALLQGVPAGEVMGANYEQMLTSKSED
jgi:regulator of RNase E activity RraA